MSREKQITGVILILARKVSCLQRECAGIENPSYVLCMCSDSLVLMPQLNRL